MENQDVHYESDEEVQGLELNDPEEAPLNESNASDYKWEREMQELWREMDAALEEVEEEDPESSLEEEFDEPVYVVRKVD